MKFYWNEHAMYILYSIVYIIFFSNGTKINLYLI